MQVMKEVMVAITEGKEESCPGVKLLCMVLSEKQIRAQLLAPQGWNISKSWSKKTVATVSCSYVCACMYVSMYVCEYIK